MPDRCTKIIHYDPFTVFIALRVGTPSTCSQAKDECSIPVASTNPLRPTFSRLAFLFAGGAGGRGGSTRIRADFGDGPSTPFRPQGFALSGRFFSPGWPGACGRSPQAAEFRTLRAIFRLVGLRGCANIPCAAPALSYSFPSPRWPPTVQHRGVDWGKRPVPP